MLDLVQTDTCPIILVPLVVVVVASVAGCHFERDHVLPGAYGPEQAGNSSMAAAPTTARPNDAVAGVSPIVGASAAGATAPSSTSGSAPSSMAGMTAPSSMMTPPPTAAEPTQGPGVTAPQNAASATRPCDLSGRWLVTLHYVTDALGQLQYCHSYIYYEIEQTADSFTVKKGLLCGDDAVGDGDFAATVDFRTSWDAVASRVQYAGRNGTSAAVSGGCQVDVQKWYTVRGATLPYYTDPANPLPSAEQPAMASTPGWEDWDMDGNPGLTGVISGVVSGKIFTAPRQWTSMSGSVPSVAQRFELPLQWDQEANVMAYDGSPLLSSSAVRASDATLHFAQFARLGADQAVGDDKAICANLTQLAKSLTAEAAAM